MNEYLNSKEKTLNKGQINTKKITYKIPPASTFEKLLISYYYAQRKIYVELNKNLGI